MYLLRVYYGAEIREREIELQKSYTVGKSEADSIRLEEFSMQKKSFSVSAREDGWVLSDIKKAPEEVRALLGRVIPFEKICVLDETKNFAVVVYRSGPDCGRMIDISQEKELVIGRSSACDIVIGSRQISGRHLRMIREGELWEYEDLKSSNGTYVDGARAIRGQFRDGSVICLGFCRLMLNGQKLLVSYDGAITSHIVEVHETKSIESIDQPYPYLFKQSPRLREDIVPEIIDLQTPPTIGGKPTISWASVLVTPILSVAVMIGVCMLVTKSMNMLYYSVPSTLIGIIMGVARYRGEKKKYREKEQLRLNKYDDYLDEKISHIEHLVREQRRILNESAPATAQCTRLAEGPARTLWDRRLRDSDFMVLRVGSGTLPAEFEIKAPRQMLSLETDHLADRPSQIVAKYAAVDGCPIVMDFGTQPGCGIIGDRSRCIALGKNLVVQATVHHSYEDLRVVVVCDTEEREEWAFCRWLPHIYDDSRQMRYFADNAAQAEKMLSQIEEVLQQRIMENVNSEYSAKPIHRPFYLFVCASMDLVVNHAIMKRLAQCDRSLGVGALFLFDRMDHLPKDCCYVAEMGAKNVLYQKDHASIKQSFVLDAVGEEQYERYARTLAPIRVEMSGKNAGLPLSLSFLQGFGTRTPSMLPLADNWRNPTPERSMAVPVGMKSDGQPFLFDIHEKQHGPHGLVAGMTGSGKSEMVQSWILSMAIRFPPSAVSFVLIDFKGTGLLLPFKKLPHLAGTISDLDTSIGRNLIALQNELNRRKMLLDQHGVSNIAAYRKLLRQGTATEPLSYLFVVIDEFAEFKMRFPDFMQAVNSVFAIGRTLGVHMLLLTQKPANVVDDKMNANTRFRWCLKVASSADSREMLRHADAAKITNPGRAYVQVGEDEVYEQIQSYWSGAPYNPYRDLNMQRTDKVFVMDYYGNRVSYEQEKTVGFRAEKSEIDVIIDHLDTYVTQNDIVRARPIWTAKLPETVVLQDLLEEGFDGERWSEDKQELCPAFGLLDDPKAQGQYPVRLNLSKDGHISIFGAPGSGKTTLLHTAILSMAMSYSPDQVHMYMLDFGGGSMNLFKNLPHVGGVAVSGEDERVNKLTTMISNELSRRKKLMSDLGVVSIAAYREASGEPVPYIVLILDNFAPVLDMYPGMDVFFQSFVRDGGACGMYFVVTANTQNALNYRVSQNIKTAIALRMSDKSDYGAIVGSTGGMEPENHPGRGLVRGTPPLEFQTALPVDGKSELERVGKLRGLVSLMASKWTKAGAEEIPMVPEIVREEDYPSKDIFLGVALENVTPQILDLRDKQYLLFSGQGESEDMLNSVYQQIVRKIQLEQVVAFGEHRDGVDIDWQMAKAFDNSIAALMPILQKRKEKAQGGKLDEAEDPYIAVIVDGLKACFDQVSNDTVRRLSNIVTLGKGLNILLVAADSSQNIGILYHGGDTLSINLVNRATVVLRGGTIYSHGVFQADLPYSEVNLPIEKDCAVILNDGDICRIKAVQG